MWYNPANINVPYPYERSLRSRIDTALRSHLTNRRMMEEQMLTLRHHQDACPSLNLSLAEQVRDMQLNDIPSLYADFRSPSRTRQRTLRKRRNPTRRRTRCLGYCNLCSPRDLSNRRRRLERHLDECNDEAYRDERIVDLDLVENLFYMDLVQRYYNHGHNAEVMESLRPVRTASEEEEEEEEEEEQWADAHNTPDTYGTSSSTTEAESIPTTLWSIVIYRTLAPYSDWPTAKVHACCTFTWHRNASGIWELGYASQTLSAEALDPYGCKQTPLPLSCLCCSPSFGLYACSCAAFPNNWKSPEDPQRAYLTDWMGEGAWKALMEGDGKARDGARNRELQSESAGDNCADWTVVRTGTVRTKTRITKWTFVPSASPGHSEEAEWDVVSEVSSTGSWRIVDVA